MTNVTRPGGDENMTNREDLQEKRTARKGLADCQQRRTFPLGEMRLQSGVA